MYYKELLAKHGLSDISVLSSDTKDFIKELTALEKSKLPTIKKDGEYTEAAAKKAARINKVICDGIIDYVTDIEDAREAEAQKERQAEQARLAAEQEEADRNAEVLRLQEEERLAEEAKKNRKLFGIFGV
jgi:hypothetical protein